MHERSEAETGRPGIRPALLARPLVSKFSSPIPYVLLSCWFPDLKIRPQPKREKEIVNLGVRLTDDRYSKVNRAIEMFLNLDVRSDSVARKIKPGRLLRQRIPQC